MFKQRVDYDSLAAGYDHRFDHSQPDDTLSALSKLRRKISASRVLEVGCGTGHWLAGLEEESPAEPCWFYGLDLSFGMLGRARAKCAALHLAQGQAERLPYPQRAFGMVYCVNAIHHFGDPRAFIFETRRLLSPGGALAVIGTGPRGHREDWYIYHYFPGTYETDLARFPSWGTIVDWMLEAGFGPIRLELARHIHDPKVGAEVLSDPYIQKHAASQLALLSDEAYEAGLARIRGALAAAQERQEELVFACDIYLHMLVARAPG